MGMGFVGAGVRSRLARRRVRSGQRREAQQILPLLPACQGGSCCTGRSASLPRTPSHSCERTEKRSEFGVCGLRFVGRRFVVFCRSKACGIEAGGGEVCIAMAFTFCITANHQSRTTPGSCSKTKLSARNQERVPAVTNMCQIGNGLITWQVKRATSMLACENTGDEVRYVIPRPTCLRARDAMPGTTRVAVLTWYGRTAVRAEVVPGCVVSQY